MSKLKQSHITSKNSDFFPFLFTDIKYNVSYALMKWVYTDDINIESDSGFLLELLRAATRFKLEHLRQRYASHILILCTLCNR
jgi:hypothetical protein